jgi:hypothetical protein
MESGVNKVAKPWMAVMAAFGCLTGTAFAQAPAQTPATVTVLGQIEKVEAGTRTVQVKTEEGSTLTVTLAEKGTVVKVAPGEKSLQNAAPISFDVIATGDRVMVRGGVRTDAKVEGALRIVVMAKTDLAARNEEEQRAWRERGIAGTVTAVDPAKGEFSIHVSGAPAPGSPAAAPTATPTVTVEAAKATLHRYSDTSVKFDDAKPAAVKDVAVGDQARLLGKRSEDGSRITADKVVFGSFKTMALAIEKVDAATGVLSVKDLETNRKFTLSVVQGATIRKIPTEMATMFAMMGAGGGRPGMGGAGMAGGASRGDRAGGGQPGQAGMGLGGAPSGQPGQAGPGGRPGAAGRGGRMEDMVERLPAITIADLKKDDWIGAVVGKADASGRAVAFNMLAGIEAFASRANRSGGVDVGMPAGLLDGALGIP